MGHVCCIWYYNRFLLLLLSFSLLHCMIYFFSVIQFSLFQFLHVLHSFALALSCTYVVLLISHCFNLFIYACFFILCILTSSVPFCGMGCESENSVLCSLFVASVCIICRGAQK